MWTIRLMVHLQRHHQITLTEVFSKVLVLIEQMRLIFRLEEVGSLAQLPLQGLGGIVSDLRKALNWKSVLGID